MPDTPNEADYISSFNRRLERLRRFVELGAAQAVVQKELALIKRDLASLDEEEQARIRQELLELGFEV